jgi:hypothetical protein
MLTWLDYQDSCKVYISLFPTDPKCTGAKDAQSTKIKIFLKNIFSGFTNVPLYKLMQHRPRIASPDMQQL